MVHQDPALIAGAYQETEVTVTELKPTRITRAKSEKTTQNILDTAADIIRNDGLHACTYRAIAGELGISPGTISWHFKTLDDLHGEVIGNAVNNFTLQTKAWFSEFPSGKPEIQLTQFIFWTLGQHTRLLREYELFVAAVSRPGLRKSAQEWIYSHRLIVQDTFSLSATQADAIVAYTDAWFLRYVLSDGNDAPDRGVTERVFRSILEHL